MDWGLFEIGTVLKPKVNHVMDHTEYVQGFINRSGCAYPTPAMTFGRVSYQNSWGVPVLVVCLKEDHDQFCCNFADRHRVRVQIFL